MSLLGLDVGTTGCKAAVYSRDGSPLSAAYRAMPISAPRPGWAELDSAEAFRRVKEAIAEAAAAPAARADPVSAIGISSMGEAATPVTAARRILGPSILMSDSRGAEYIARLAETMGQEEFYRINPNILSPSYTMPKLCWLRDHRPDLYRQADYFLLWADLVAFLLGGEARTNYSHANRTLLFDLRAEDWSDRLMEAAGLDRAKFAPCVPSGTVAGELPRALAAELGLPAGAAIVTGGHDQCLSALGAGIHAAGSAVCGIGTYECITPIYDHIPDAAFMLAHGLNVEHHVLPGLFVSFIYNQGGALVDWFGRTFAAADARLLADGQDIHDVLAAEMPPEPTPLLVLPHFDVTGPPHFLSDCTGAILGLRTATRRGEILKAILECETLYFVDSVEALREMGVDVSRFIATGGGARSDAWLQIKADVFGVPFIRPQVTDAAALGAAMLAGLATGAFQSPAEAAERFCRPVRTFEPDPARHAFYRDKLARYRQLYPSLRSFLAGDTG